MKKTSLIAALALAAAETFAAPLPKQTPVKACVPATLDEVRLIDPAAAKANHILIVNVGNAIPAADWGRIVTYAASRLQLNIWTNAVAASPYPEILTNPQSFVDRFGKKVRLGVILEDCADTNPYVTVPGSWCRVNLRPLKADKPDVQTLEARYAKAILRGLAFAAGTGAGLDSRSATFYGAMSLPGMDKTAITLAPDTYFPMMETLQAIGGSEMTHPARTEEE